MPTRCERSGGTSRRRRSAPPLIGLALLMTRRFWTDPSFFVVFIGIGLFVFDHLRIVPEHFWAARRFVPIILPGTLLADRRRAGAGGPARQVGGRAPGLRRPAGPASRAAGAGGVELLERDASRSDRTSSTRASFRNSNSSPRDSGPTTCSSSSRATRRTCTCWRLPLAYIYGKQVLLLATPRPDSLRFAQFLRWAREHASQRLFPGRRRHGPALARGGGGGRRGRAVPGARIRVAAETATRPTCGTRSSTSGSTASSIRCRTRKAWRSTSARWTTSTSCGSTRRSETSTARSDGPARSRTSRWSASTPTPASW